MGRSEELFSEENKERLVSIYEKTDLERAALIDKNGDAYYDNGVTKNVSHRRYFRRPSAESRPSAIPWRAVWTMK